jgi:predicted Zn-dependent protease
MAPPTCTDATGNWDEATAVATPHERVKVVRDFVAGLRGLDAAGFVETSGERAVYVNSAGQHLRGRRTWATVDGLARTSTSDGVARGSAVRLGDLRGVEAGSVAAAAARSATEPSHLDAGEYEVVLAPGCVASILRNLARCGFNGCPVLAGQSFVELGARQFDPAIRLWDDATDSLSTSLPYDAEGTPRGRIDLVVDGVSRGVLHDRRTAAAASVQSTRQATPGSERSGPYPTDLRLAVGDGGHTDDLVRRLRRGLLITDFGQTRVVEPRAVVVAGFTRHAAWLVEQGEVIRPVRDLRFTQSYVDALGPGAVIAVGSVSGALLDQRGSGVYVAPSIALAGWRVHGSAG